MHHFSGHNAPPARSQSTIRDGGFNPSKPAWELDKKESNTLTWYVNADWWNTEWANDTVTKVIADELNLNVEFVTGDDTKLNTYFASEALNETGLKKVAEYKADLIATGLYRQRPVCADNEETIEMDISLLEASAGTGNILDEGGFEKVSFPVSAVPSNADFGVRVHGDSMEPVYHDGQIVWVKRCETLLPGDIGIFVYDGNGYLKKYGEREPEEPDREGFVDSNGVLRPQPLLISYNPAYAPIQVSPQAMFRVVGQVLN